MIHQPFLHLDKSHGRRRFLQGLGFAGAALFTTRGLFAEQLIATPNVTEGPFYPDKMPLDTDNDLIIVNDSIISYATKSTRISYLTSSWLKYFNIVRLG